MFNIQQLREDLKRDEGLRLKPYKCTKGKTTIGIGRNLTDRGISEDEAYDLLNNDIKDVTRSLDIAIPYWKHQTEARQRALANMCFNMGLDSLLGFINMLRYIREGDFEKAAEEALDSKWRREDVSEERSSRIANMIRKG